MTKKQMERELTYLRVRMTKLESDINTLIIYAEKQRGLNTYIFGRMSSFDTKKEDEA